MNTDAARQILDAVSKALARQKADGTRFNVLRALRVNDLENVCSNVLEYVLNPQGEHGLGALPLQTFCAQCLENFPKEFRFPGATVVREYWMNAEDRPDFFITDGVCKIIIEAKIHAGEQSGQINRYWRAIGGKSPTTAVYFLTLDGYCATTGTPTACLSWNETVTHWLKTLMECEEVVRMPYVCNQLKTYWNLLNDNRRLFMETDDVLFGSRDSLNALFEVRKYLDAGVIMKKIQALLEKQLGAWIMDNASRFNLEGCEVVSGYTPYYFSFKTKDFWFSAQFHSKNLGCIKYGFGPLQQMSEEEVLALKTELNQSAGKPYPYDIESWWYCSWTDEYEWTDEALLSMLLFDEEQSKQFVDRMFSRIMEAYETYAKMIAEARKALGL